MRNLAQCWIEDEEWCQNITNSVLHSSTWDKLLAEDSTFKNLQHPVSKNGALVTEFNSWAAKSFYSFWLKQHSSGFSLKAPGIFPPLLTSDWWLSGWKQKWGRRSKWIWHSQGVLLQGEWKIEGGLISLKNPSCRCGRGCLYCLVCFHGNSYGVRTSSCLLLLLSVQYLVKFPPLFPSLFFPLSPTCTDMVCSVLGGEYSGMRWRTHIHTVCLCAAGGADLGNNESQKETFLQEDMEL